ncbi:MAG: BMC domain-containing protein [Neisseriales bacterium]|nr:MAG: BMC domain-containing protein [Neisseriales bacterium]
MDALGFLEVQGFTTAVSAADAMLKSANVVLLSTHEVRPGMLTIVVSGDLAACRAAVSAGLAAAKQVGKVLSHHVIGRLDEDGVLNTLISTGQTCTKPAISTLPASAIGQAIAKPQLITKGTSPKPLEVEKSLDPILALVMAAPKGKTIKQIRQQFTNQKTQAIRAKLMMWVKAGRLIQKGEKFYPLAIEAI